jgi:hypothetical protein
MASPTLMRAHTCLHTPTWQHPQCGNTSMCTPYKQLSCTHTRMPMQPCPPSCGNMWCHIHTRREYPYTLSSSTSTSPAEGLCLTLHMHIPTCWACVQIHQQTADSRQPYSSHAPGAHVITHATEHTHGSTRSRTHVITQLLDTHVSAAVKGCGGGPTAVAVSHVCASVLTVS